MTQPDNQKNLLIAIVLSIVVLLGWQMFYASPKMQEEQARRQTQQQTTSPSGVPAPGAETTGVPTPGGVTAPGAAVGPGGLAPTRAAALAASPRVAIDTPAVGGSIALKGGRIDDLVLKRYRETVDPNSPNVILLSPAEGPNAYFAEYGWVAPPGSSARLPDRETVWQMEGSGTLTPQTPITLVWDNGQGLTFRRTISIDDNYMFTVKDAVDNKSAGDVTLFPYARLRREGTPHIQGFFILHEGLIGVLGQGGFTEITYAKALDDGGKTVDKAVGGWLGITDKYWAATLIPNQSVEYRGTMTGNKRTDTQIESYQTDYLLPATIVAAGASAETEGKFFAGARKVSLVQSYADNLSILQFDLLIDWGWFYFITKPLFWLIEWLYGLLGNFGLAILAVTVIVKLAFFPLANKSYESMAKMKKLQPDMERIRERYKDDKMRQQQELMALYKNEKINPLAGCLPILIQIPVFFALYKVLFVTIDMRHAPFFGWIRDLSAPDPTSIFNLFGLLPFAVPEFLHIGAWPILMGITMWVQMQLNPQQPDPLQQKIFNWMPVLFTFLLASFPAGLVIYWAWNNVLSLTQQWLIMKRQGVEVPIFQNMKRNFAPLIGLFTGRKSKPEPVKAAPAKAAPAKPAEPVDRDDDVSESSADVDAAPIDETEAAPEQSKPKNYSRKPDNNRGRRPKR
ncbi:membrane protein insertase YidC [Leptospira interrogans]